MRLAGTIPTEDYARRFYGYLLTLGITSKVEPNDGKFAVWVREEEHVERAVRELDEFLRHPEEPRYAEAFETARRIVREEVAKDRKARKNVIELRGRWGRGLSGPKTVTMTLIAASVLVAIWSQWGQADTPIVQNLSICTWKNGGPLQASLAEIAKGQVWRLVTPIFIHFGFGHLLFNMWMLFDFGRVLESRRGPIWLVAMTAAVAIPSNVAQYVWQGPAFGGMSGVLYGLFGYMWMKHRYDPSAGIRLKPFAIVLMVGWFFLCMTGTVGPIANMAHSVGMVTGIVIGLAPVVWRKLVG
ncbi:MAG TPA: rhomboid family intramembrane serine protease [Pirellulales bacterium]|jgi:GlpG protein|nr:rhomboid family intramembrane serine protease [Pirellulales bacterium]